MINTYEWCNRKAQRHKRATTLVFWRALPDSLLSNIAFESLFSLSQFHSIKASGKKTRITRWHWLVKFVTNQLPGGCESGRWGKTNTLNIDISKKINNVNSIEELGWETCAWFEILLLPPGVKEHAFWNQIPESITYSVYQAKIWLYIVLDI